MPAASDAAQPTRCRAGLSLKLFPRLPPLLPHPPRGCSVAARLPSLPAVPATPAVRGALQTGGLWLSGAGAGAGGTKVFLLVVVMEMMLPAAAGSLQRR